MRNNELREEKGKSDKCLQIKILRLQVLLFDI